VEANSALLRIEVENFMMKGIFRRMYREDERIEG
jgi:hypothetical protein